MKIIISCRQSNNLDNTSSRNDTYIQGSSFSKVRVRYFSLFCVIINSILLFWISWTKQVILSADLWTFHRVNDKWTMAVVITCSPTLYHLQITNTGTKSINSDLNGLQFVFLITYYWGIVGCACTSSQHKTNIRNMHIRGFLFCSHKSFCLFLHLPCGKCNIGCDTSTGLSAGQRPTSIQPHHNTSILRDGDTLRTFCAKRSRPSLCCGTLRSDDSRTDVFVHKHSPRTPNICRACLTLQL